MKKVSRRNFLSAISSSVIGLGMTHKTQASTLSASPQSEAAPPEINKYNPLGKTGIKVSDVSFGAISLFEPNVMRYAYDLGVNYFDTAESYLRTNSEKYIGQALKDVRDKVYITTKHRFPAPKEIKRGNIIKRVEASLQRMQTDYVDVALIHDLGDLSLLRNEELSAAYSRLKQQGKVRFTGFSTHNAKKTLAQAIQNDDTSTFTDTDVVLIIYNHLEGPAIESLLEKVRKKGIGTIAMKVFAGGKHGSLKSFISDKVSYPQAAIRWALSNKNVDCCIVTMSSYSHVEEYVAASNQPLDSVGVQAIDRYQKAAHNHYCRVSCQECLSACPHQVAVNEILRFSMYFEDYKMEKEAMRYYSELPESRKANACFSCSYASDNGCAAACPYGLDIRAKLQHAHRILSV